MARDKRSTEYGGIPGRIAPVPHTQTPAEEARIMRAVNPALSEVERLVDTPELALLREWELERRL